MRPKKLYYLKKTTPKTAQKQKERSEKLKVYYDYHIERCNYSEENKQPILNPTRGNICHLIAKSNHKSLEDNLINFIYLTLQQHSEFDNLLERHKFEELEVQFFNAWKIACERYKILIPLCEEKTGFLFALTDYLENKFGGQEKKL